MARKTANDDDQSSPPPTQPIQNPDRKRKRNTAKEIPAEIQPNLKRKQIPYRTSTQTLKVGRYPSHKKGSNEAVDTNIAKKLKKPAGATKAHKKILPTENESDDDFVANTMSAKSQGKAKLQTAAEISDITRKAMELLVGAIKTYDETYKAALKSLNSKTDQEV